MFKPQGWVDRRVFDQADIPTDPALPQLSAILDAEFMGRLLQDKLPGGFAQGRLRIERCRIVFVRYKPPRYCHVYYALDICDSDSLQHGTQILGAKIFVKSLSKSDVSRHVKSFNSVPDYGLSFAYVPDYNMILSAFPNDLRLHNLHQLVCPDELELGIRTTLGLPTARIATDDNRNAIHVVSYRPERYCLAHCGLQPQSLASKTAGTRTIFARMFHSKEVGEQAYRAMVALWNSEARRTRLLSVSEPLGYDPISRIAYQGALAGTTLTSFTNRTDFLRHTEAAARSLAAVHQTPVDMEQWRTPEYELRGIEPMAEIMKEVLPAVSEKLQNILDRLKSNLPSTRGRDFIHGDFSPNQILVNADQLNVVDFSACMGDPHADVGNFVVSLEHYLQGSRRDQATQAFYRQYDMARPGVLDRDRLVWYQAKAHLRHAFAALKKIRPKWTRLVDQYLSRAEALLSA